MFEKLMLKEPFEKIFKKALNDCEKEKYSSKEEEFNVLEKSIEILIEETYKENFDKLEKRVLKTRKYSEKLLRKEINKLRKNVK